MNEVRRRRFLTALGALALLTAACEGGDGGGATTTPGQTNGTTATTGGTLTVYSGREEELVAALFEQFEEDTGIDVEVRYGDSAELAATILEEGDASPADVFFSQDAGSLGVLADEGALSPIDEAILDRVDARFRHPEGLWVGTSGRARVLAYSTERVDEADLPGAVTDLTAAEWRGRIGFPPTNASFQAFVAAMLLTQGEEATADFLDGLAANEPKFYEGNSDVVRGIAAGEIDVGLVNHYYIYEVAAEDGDIPVANHYFGAGDPGALVNAAGVGILGSAAHAEEARTFVDYLTGDPGQTYFAEDTFEYPLVEGLEPSVDIVPLEEIDGPDVTLSDLGAALEDALRLLADAGLV